MIGSVFLDKQTEEARRSYWQDIWIWREKKIGIGYSTITNLLFLL